MVISRIDRPYDGVDIMPMLTGSELPERTIYYYRGQTMRAVRKGQWKLHFSYFNHPPDSYSYAGNRWVTPEQPLLFNVETDPSERFDVAADNPEIVADLIATAERYKAEIERNGENRDLIDWFINDFPTAPRQGD